MHNPDTFGFIQYPDLFKGSGFRVGSIQYLDLGRLFSVLL